MAKQHTLGKNERLKSRKAIEFLFKEGRSFSSFPLRVVYVLNRGQNELLPAESSNGKEKLPTSQLPTAIGKPGHSLQAGFSVSAKNFKRAVDRNRIKRLMKESYRLQKKTLKETVVGKVRLELFFLFTGKEIPEYQFIFEKMGNALKRLLNLVHELPENHP